MSPTNRESYSLISLFDWSGGIRNRRQNPLAFPQNALVAGENVDLVDGVLNTRAGISATSSGSLPQGEVVTLRQIRFPTNEVSYLLAQVKIEPAGWEQKASGAAREDHAACWDAENVRMWVYGGGPDLSYYDPFSNTWADVESFEGPPTSITRHCMIHDPAGDRLIIFGGYDETGYSNRLWACDLATYQWTELEPTGTIPATRGDFASCYDSGNRRLFVTTGTYGSGRWRPWNPYYLLDLATLVWTEVDGGGNVPSMWDTRGTQAVYDSDRGRVILYGGAATETYCYACYEINLATSTWTGLAPIPGPTAGGGVNAPIGIYCNGKIFSCMGSVMDPETADINNTWEGALFEYDVAKNTWTNAASSSPHPARVYGASIVVTDEGHIIVYGGFGENSTVGDTWLLSSYCTTGFGGGNCLYASPTHLPTSAAEFTKIYDLGASAGPISVALLNDRCVLTEGIAEVPLVWGGCMSDDASDWMYPKAVLISQDGLHFYDITQYVCDTDEDVDANIGGIRVYGYLAVCCDMPRVKGFYFQMGRPNEGIEGTGQTATYTGTIAFTTTDDIARQDLKGNIDHWVQDSGATGHFEDATGVRLTLGPGQACPDVEEGMLVQFPDGNRTIINISANGDQDGQVELSDAHVGETVTAACGLDVLANAFNLKGLIDQWYQDSDTKGHFEGTEGDFNNAAVVQKGSGRVGLPAAGHGLVSGDYFRIYGATNYNGSYTALPATTTNEIVVEAAYAAETFTDTAKFRRRLTLGPGQACSEVKAGSLVAFADGNRTIVSITSDGEQDEEVELSDLHETAEVTAIYDLDAPNNGVSVNHISGSPAVIFAKTPTQSGNYPKQSVRQILSATEITGSGEDLIVLTIKAGDSNQIGYCELAHCSIVERDGITANGTTTPTTVTFNGGQTSVSLSPGQEIQSDEIPFIVDETKDYLVSFDLTFKRVVL